MPIKRRCDCQLAWWRKRCGRWLAACVVCCPGALVPSSGAERIRLLVYIVALFLFLSRLPACLPLDCDLWCTYVPLTLPRSVRWPLNPLSTVAGGSIPRISLSLSLIRKL